MTLSPPQRVSEGFCYVTWRSTYRTTFKGIKSSTIPKTPYNTDVQWLGRFTGPDYSYRFVEAPLQSDPTVQGTEFDDRYKQVTFNEVNTNYKQSGQLRFKNPPGPFILFSLESDTVTTPPINSRNVEVLTGSVAQGDNSLMRDKGLGIQKLYKVIDDWISSGAVTQSIIDTGLQVSINVHLYVPYIPPAAKLQKLLNGVGLVDCLDSIFDYKGVADNVFPEAIFYKKTLTPSEYGLELKNYISQLYTVICSPYYCSNLFNSIESIMPPLSINWFRLFSDKISNFSVSYIYRVNWTSSGSALVGSGSPIAGFQSPKTNSDGSIWDPTKDPVTGADRPYTNISRPIQK